MLSSANLSSSPLMYLPNSNSIMPESECCISNTKNSLRGMFSSRISTVIISPALSCDIFLCPTVRLRLKLSPLCSFKSSVALLSTSDCVINSSSKTCSDLIPSFLILFISFLIALWFLPKTVISLNLSKELLVFL